MPDSLEVIVRRFTVTSSTSAYLVFDQSGGDNGGIIIDNVRLTKLETAAVPEPSTMVLMGLGISGIAAVARTARKQRGTRPVV